MTFDKLSFSTTRYFQVVRYLIDIDVFFETVNTVKRIIALKLNQAYLPLVSLFSYYKSGQITARYFILVFRADFGRLTRELLRNSYR